MHTQYPDTAMYVKTTTKLLTLRPVEVHNEYAPFITAEFVLEYTGFDAEYNQWQYF